MSNNDNLKRLNILLRTISKINQQLVISNDEKKLCQKICSYLVKIKGYKFVWMGLKESENDKLTPIAIAGKDKDFIKYIKNSWNKYGFNGCPISMALESGMPFLIEDLKDEERFVPWDRNAIENGFLSALVLPIKYHNDVIGTLHIYSDMKNYFLEEEVSFLKEVTGDISIGIKSIRDERELIESKREYEELFKRISSCVAIYKAKDNGNDFIIKDFNIAAEKAEKIKREDIIGKSVLKVFPGVKDFGLFDVFKRVYKTGKPENHPISIYKDKRILGWRENFVYKLPTGNVVTVYNDLTNQKKAEEEINSLAKFPQENPSPVGRTDYHGKALYCNIAYKRIIKDNNHVPFKLQDAIKKIAAKKSYKPEDVVIEIGDRIFSFTIIPVKGENYINFYGIDITELKKVQENIAASEAKYRELFNSAPVGFAVIDNEGTINSINEAMLSLGGIPKEKILGKHFTEAGILKPKDIPFYLKIFTEILQGKITEPFSVTWHNTQREKITGEVYATLLKQDGKVKGFQLVARDITKQLYAEENLKKSYKKLKNTLDSMIRTLASVVETKDPYTAGHQVKVAKLSVAIAKELKLDNERIDAINNAATIHDIGKIIVPQSILSKPTVLSDLEFSLIKTHCQAAYDILKNIDFGYPIADIVMQHHERENGSGYPKGLIGSDIMLEAKIIAVADVVEAMSSHRPYRPSHGIKKALEEIESNKNILYDSVVVDACIKIIKNKIFEFQ